jgi:hypothetical protein
VKRIVRAALVFAGLFVVGAAHADEVGRHDQVAAESDDGVSYGVAMRLRYVSVPGWTLELFTTHNVPLATLGHFGIEFFRRRGKTDLVGALSYQNMSPPDGNWLGIGHQASTDTNFVQFKGLAIYNVDFAFLSRETFNDWVGMHYGAGLGIGIVTGHVVRTIYSCNESDFGRCRPPATLNTRAETSVPPVVPIVNVVVGVDFRVPSVDRWEVKLEAGFYDAFFLGLGVGYRL